LSLNYHNLRPPFLPRFRRNNLSTLLIIFCINAFEVEVLRYSYRSISTSSEKLGFEVFEYCIYSCYSIAVHLWEECFVFFSGFVNVLMEVVRVSFFFFFMKPFCSGFLPIAILLCSETEFGKGDKWRHLDEGEFGLQ